MNTFNRSLVTPYFPERGELENYLDDMYASGWLTNDGPLVRKLESRLAELLDVPYVIVVANGTLALQIAFRLLELRGQVITTPLSFVATANALQWEGLVPRFADVDSNFTLDPTMVADLITPETSALLPVHLFGQACQLDAIQEVVHRHRLKVIYDAAQAFGLKSQGQSVLKWGDVSVLSFHATKVFHTIEGGAIVVKDKSMAEHAMQLRNHGRRDGHATTPAFGINAKLSEMHAAVGHCLLDRFDEILSRYTVWRSIYCQRLSRLTHVSLPKHVERDHACNIYMPVLIQTSELRECIEAELTSMGIPIRRYFDPPLNQLSHFANHDDCPGAGDIASRLLLLPIPAQADPSVAHDICDAVSNHGFTTASTSRLSISSDA
jgi:dTDP-4-amino-4,6-dideoxygalactose transaminase